MHTRHLWLAAATLLALLGAARFLAPAAISRGLRHAAGERGFTIRWDRLSVRSPLRAGLRGIVVCERAHGDTLATADSLAVSLDPWSLAFFHPRASEIMIAHARLRLVAHPASRPDTLGPEEDLPATVTPRAARLRHAAESLAGLLLAPARRLPRLEVRDLVVAAPTAGDTPLRGGRLAWLALDHAPGGMRLRATGALDLEHPTPFDLELSYGHDDRLTGAVLLGLGDPASGPDGRLRVTVNGALAQDRHSGVLRLADSTRVSFGRLPVTLGGSIEQRGPRLRFRLATDDITEARILASVPREALGPLTGLAMRGSFDYRLALDLDLARPDSVRFEADVIPHGLRLDSARTTLDLFRLEQPFLATIHLPHERRVTREMSSSNPFFRLLDGIDSILVHAVLTNEDGGFFRHRGFNPDAIQLAIAFNLKAGAWRRGAGTVTMQLARNLWLGHARTLSRKAQEVVLAWVLEHLTGVSKRRLLELYLNIIEWGPDIHGAAEATRYYFDKDPAQITVDEALFLATVLPAPAKWRYRFAPDGSLRPFERAQMHFIGRAMIARDRLDPALLPPADSLSVTLRGQAREALFPPDSVAADSAGPGVLARRAGDGP